LPVADFGANSVVSVVPLRFSAAGPFTNGQSVARRQMAKKNHQNEAVSSAKVPLSGLLGGRSPSSPIAPSAARRQNEVLSSTALPQLAEVAAGAKLRSRGTLRRPRDVDHELEFGGLHPGEHHSNRTHSQRHEKTDLPQAPKPEAFEFIPGPKLRAKLGISAVTLWRWRHDKEKGFPAPKVINGRLYFALGAVMAWLARQADAA
jgi:predicted DNA-binding transcriptional regulator AlpA